jgi:chromosome segregation ATPase
MEELRERIRSLESQCKSKDTLLQSLQAELEVEKSYKGTIRSEMESREAEITMQKVTINHLQDALVSLKRGHGHGPTQPPPSLPTAATARSNVYHI